MHYLYITTNAIDGKKYVGQRKCPVNTVPEKDYYLGSGTRLLYAIKKYGKAYFSKEIISIHESQVEIDKAEIDFIKENDVLCNKELWYNIDAGGQYWKTEKSSEIISTIMKSYYSIDENYQKLIASKNTRRTEIGLLPLPYKTKSEYINYKNEKDYKKHKNFIINRLSWFKSRKGHRMEKEAWSKFVGSNDHIELRRLKAANSAGKLWNNKQSAAKRNTSHIHTWNKRKESESIWTNDNKQSFAIGKLKQYNNPIGIYLIDCGVSLRVDGLQKKIKKCFKQYKDITNMHKQIDNIVCTIYNTQKVRIDKEELTRMILERRANA